MAQASEVLRVALSAAKRLPSKLQRELAERPLESAAPDRDFVTVRLRRLTPRKQRRLSLLMDKVNEGTLTRSERAEIEKLGAEVDETMLENSITLARAARPELFDVRGQLLKNRFRQSLSSTRGGRRLSARESSDR